MGHNKLTVRDLTKVAARWHAAPAKLRREIATFVNYWTQYPKNREKNRSYLVGYLKGLHDMEGIAQSDFSYWLNVVGAIDDGFEPLVLELQTYSRLG